MTTYQLSNLSCNICKKNVILAHTHQQKHRRANQTSILCYEGTAIKGDWIFLLKEDLEKVGLGLEDEESISIIKKHTFKKYLK